MLKKLFFLFLFSISAFAQTSGPRIIMPRTPGWNVVREGDTLAFSMRLQPDTLKKHFKFEIQQGKVAGMELDSSGNFLWVPAYHLVDRVEQEKVFQIIVEAKDNKENKITSNVDFKVLHTNRPPVLNNLKSFYVQYNHNNVYKITQDQAYDEDNDPIVFVPNLETLPEGMNMSTQGEITWNPSINQFKKLKESPQYIEFTLQDQPAKSSVKGTLKLEVTQMDLPPQITVVPKADKIQLKENEKVNLRFYLSDPNGEEDIEVFDFVTNAPDFPKQNTLVKNSNNQYEFTWSPGYDFVQDPADTLSFYIDFFVLDKTQNREVKRVNFVVKNTVNEVELDRKNYSIYYGVLVNAWELLEQLKEKEEELKKDYNRARKGKKNRSVVNASLGATTGLSSVIANGNADTQKLISAVGGTTTLTISTLEATEVIGKSMKDVIDRLNYVIEKKNEIQTKGDIFARDFSLKSSRRGNDFIKKVDEFNNTMNLKGLVALELNATWENKKKASESNIKKTFKDFVMW
ncbi:hypothetical protein [Leadbetterella byssophila]|jgi:hypothetical protein|uniref:hypothetical protein n=1 Tax=Leadbetterella byssophila TaxID=316068 RepID=UPI0039A17328